VLLSNVCPNLIKTYRANLYSEQIQAIEEKLKEKCGQIIKPRR
jgi:hypothetical protein